MSSSTERGLGVTLDLDGVFVPWGQQHLETETTSVSVSVSVCVYV